MEASLPPAVAPALRALLEQRYVHQREEAAGWRGLFEEVEDEETGGTRLVATEDVAAGETVFLIDHLWCTTLFGARKQLEEHPVVRRNLQYVLGIDEDSESEDEDEEEDEEEQDDEQDAAAGALPESELRGRLLRFVNLESAEAMAALTELDLDGIVDTTERREPAFLRFLLGAIPTLCPRLETLSLQALGIGAGMAAEVKAMVLALPTLRALWLNENPVARLVAADVEVASRLEILNRRLTPAYTGWALRYLATGEDEDGAGPTKLDLAGRGLSALKPEAFAELPHLRWLDLRRNPLGPDASLLLPPLLFETVAPLSRLESLRIQLPPSSSSVDETEASIARRLPQLRWINGRYITRLDGDGDGNEGGIVLDGGGVVGGEKGGSSSSSRRQEEIVDKILARVWSHAEPMRLAASERHHSEVHWCVLDLPGLALGHAASASEPNMGLLHMRDRALGVTFTAAWPARAIRKGDRVTRDYLEGFSPAAAAAAAGTTRLLGHLVGGRRLRQLVGGDATDAGAADGVAPGTAAAPSTEEEEQQQQPAPIFPIGDEGAAGPVPQRPLRVFTDMPVLRESLNLPDLFTFTEDAQDADILWMASASFPSSPSSSPRQWRSVLPNLAAVDDKCGMAKLLRGRGGGEGGREGAPQQPRWLPRTFCLPEELGELLAHWAKHEEEEQQRREEPLWILKPPHLARGWDIVLASELPCVLRHLQASGRLSVSRYIANPDLWTDGHKYDLRLYVLLLSPTQVLIHDHFRVRRAAEPYSLRRAHRHDLRRHLTNTTLGGSDDDEAEAGCPTETLRMEEFVQGFDARQQSHGGGGGGPSWAEVRGRIEGMLRECFARLAAADAEDGGGGGLGGDPYGRALLGVDVLLDAGRWEPHLIELNASPNVIGIVRERPSFFDEVFTAAFVNKDSSGLSLGGFRPLMGREDA